MNDLLQLKGVFHQKVNSAKPRPSQLSKTKVVTAAHLRDLKNDLITVRKIWESNKILPKALLSVYYNEIVAKSRRISHGFISKTSAANASIVGAKFTEDKKKHIITHYVPLGEITESIRRLDASIDILEDYFGGEINGEQLEKISKRERKDINFTKIARTTFLYMIAESYYIESFNIEKFTKSTENNTIISLYKTDLDTRILLEKLGIRLSSENIIYGDGDTVLLTPDQIDILRLNAPYLISMAVSDISQLSKDKFIKDKKFSLPIPHPKNEPVVGVIDTVFNDEVYFSEWVTPINMLSPDITVDFKDKMHGTAVTSIIVDGPKLNPELEDGCGRFRVRHFGVTIDGPFSSFAILKMIEKIVASNRDIKVWNISLGSTMEINQNFISPEAAILDKIQHDNDVIFIVSGTNKDSTEFGTQRIGAPADSINSLVVNAVDFEDKPADYSRKGGVLSFYNKPDISYYGGDKNKKIATCIGLEKYYAQGTSLSAPWITRKMAYLIEIIGMNREVAKALLIDSAANWGKKGNLEYVGYGVVPKKIEDILKSQDNEIKFMISGVSEKYDTYAYNIPIPTYKDSFPFIAKATLCYFPKCSRNQGVDYTNTELDLSFGRITSAGISTINDKDLYKKENELRGQNRKWDNVKHIRDTFTPNPRPKKMYDTNFWGISIKRQERIKLGEGVGTKFGLIVTLKEINGVNRIEEFISQCSLKGWLVTKVNIENSIEIYNKAEEEINFKE